MKLVIFGCGRIANRIAKSALKVEQIDLVGFASRDIEKAKSYCETYDCREYGDYDHFLNSDVDAVYIATYNGSHHELIKKCIDHHKNVICEKPMLFSVEENKELFAYAKSHGVLLMEALKSVFLPSIIEIKKMIDEGTLGKISLIYASFMREGHHPKDHWINDLRTGGAFKDLGSYCVGTMNFLMGKRPELLSLQSDRNEEHAESSAYASLDYDGVHGLAFVSNSRDGDTLLRVTGERGYIEAQNFWKQGKIVSEIDGVRKEKDIELVSDFYYELCHFADLCDQGIKESSVMSEKASEDILYITGQIDDYKENTMDTERLILRHWRDKDIPSLYKYAKDPSVGPIAGWPPHQSEAASAWVMHTALNKKECYAIALKDTNEAIGCIELKLKGYSDFFDNDEECELGYWLGKPHWNKGYMSEAVQRMLKHAFEDLHMKKVWCAYYDGNERSKRVQEKAGFIYQWTSKDVDVPLLKEKRIGHVNCMTKDDYNKRYGGETL